MPASVTRRPPRKFPMHRPKGRQCSCRTLPQRFSNPWNFCVAISPIVGTLLATTPRARETQLVRQSPVRATGSRDRLTHPESRLLPAPLPTQRAHSLQTVCFGSRGLSARNAGFGCAPAHRARGVYAKSSRPSYSSSPRRDGRGDIQRSAEPCAKAWSAAFLW